MSKTVDRARLVDLLEQTTRLIHGAGHANGLYPAQWTALRFFQRADPEPRTVADLMRFQNMALSPVARTVRSLVEKGLLARRENPRDRRSDLISLTKAGHAALAGDPFVAVDAALDGLSDPLASALGMALETFVAQFISGEDAKAAPSRDA